MMPIANNAPSHVKRGTSISMAATSSAIPEAILPQGSIPTVVKIYTDSGEAVNLKNSVWSKITAGRSRSTHAPTVFSWDIWKVIDVVICSFPARIRWSRFSHALWGDVDDQAF